MRIRPASIYPRCLDIKKHNASRYAWRMLTCINSQVPGPARIDSTYRLSRTRTTGRVTDTVSLSALCIFIRLMILQSRLIKSRSSPRSTYDLHT